MLLLFRIPRWFGPAIAVAALTAPLAGCSGAEGDAEEAVRDFFDAYYGQDCEKLRSLVALKTYQFGNVDAVSEDEVMFEANTPAPNSFVYEDDECVFLHEETSFEIQELSVGDIEEESDHEYTTIKVIVERRGAQPQRLEIGVTNETSAWRVYSIVDPTVDQQVSMGNGGYMANIPVDLG